MTIIATGFCRCHAPGRPMHLAAGSEWAHDDDDTLAEHRHIVAEWTDADETGQRGCYERIVWALTDIGLVGVDDDVSNLMVPAWDVGVDGFSEAWRQLAMRLPPHGMPGLTVKVNSDGDLLTWHRYHGDGDGQSSGSLIVCDDVACNHPEY